MNNSMYLKVLARANAWAKSLNHGFIGTEHFLLAILELIKDALQTYSLVFEEVDVEAIKKNLLTINGKGKGKKPRGNIPYTPHANLALNAARALSKTLKGDGLTPGHLLLGIMQIDKGCAAAALKEAGFTAESMKNKVRLAIQISTQEEMVQERTEKVRKVVLNLVMQAQELCWIHNIKYKVLIEDTK